MHGKRVEHNTKTTKKFLIGLYAHIPVFALMAYFFRTEYTIAIGLSLFFLLAPTVMYFIRPQSFITSAMIGMVSMFFSAIMIHLGKGMIEWHFHIFCLIAILSLYGSLSTVLTAAATIAIHHLSFFYFFPRSLFNYDAGIEIVLLHAAFVVLETIPVLFIANKIKWFVEMEGSVFSELSKLSNQNQKNSVELSSAASELDATARTQNESVESTAAAIDQMKAMLKAVADNVEQSLSLSNEGLDHAKTGNESVKKMTNEMKTLEDSLTQLNEIKEVIEEINTKTEVINDIVFKTKLLSFNASIEAARAGQHGKGFAVVAAEVGTLARQSGDASEEIEALIGQSNTKVTGIVEYIGKNVENGRKKSEEVVTNFQEIETTIHKISNTVREFSAASKEQSNAIELVSNTMQ